MPLDMSSLMDICESVGGKAPVRRLIYLMTFMDFFIFLMCVYMFIKKVKKLEHKNFHVKVLCLIIFQVLTSITCSIIFLSLLNKINDPPLKPSSFENH